jgi:iron-sulfur cluster assembly accessory protein
VNRILFVLSVFIIAVLASSVVYRFYHACVQTENAISRIKELTANNAEHIGIKIGVRRRGCNGYSYTMNYATQEDVDGGKHEIVRADSLYVLVDPKAIFYIVGTIMDYEVSVIVLQLGTLVEIVLRPMVCAGYGVSITVYVQ